MHYTTLLSPEQQAFETVRAALEWMGIEVCHCLYASPNPTVIDLTIILTAESFWQALYAVEQGFCSDISHGDLLIVLESNDDLPGFYQVDLSVPVEVL